jgi:hypothetical protein
MKTGIHVSGFHIPVNANTAPTVTRDYRYIDNLRIHKYLRMT